MVRPGASAAVVFLGLVLGLNFALSAKAQAQCERTLIADVVAMDMPLMWNRLGAQNVNGMMYALRRNVIQREATVADPDTAGRPEASGGVLTPGNVALRPDIRPRPLVLRVAAGDCLQVEFQNLLAAAPNPFNPLEERSTIPFNLVKDNQVGGRWASFHVTGAQLVDNEQDDGSHVGENLNSNVPVNGQHTYTLYFEKEGQYVIQSYGQVFGGEGQGGNTANGLFGQVVVEPKNSAFYRSQVNRDEMNLIRSGRTDPLDDRTHPIINYEQTYPDAEPYISEGKANLPVINMVCLSGSASVTAGACATNEIVHSDINAIVGFGGYPNTGQFQPATDGPHLGALGHYPKATYPLESVGKRNPTVPNRLEPFREFSSQFHDEVATVQAFPEWFEDPVFSHVTHGVRDAFMINYGSGGIGSEIIANRLRVGPMHDCVNCAYEEFFLTAFTVADPGLLVNVPANVGLEDCSPLNQLACFGPGKQGPKAEFALFPDDPSNVHHSYTGDFVKFRNTHGGPGEQHIFHLHNHQWLWNANDDNSNYLDAQGLGAAAGYTYEINFGGSGNRNKTAGDAIFHCHFYPHFAQGMWYLWRVHDVFEEGTVLEAMAGDPDQHGGQAPYAPFTEDGLGLGRGLPRNDGAQTIPNINRALPDGEIALGTPIPGVVPLPGKPMPPMPGLVRVVSQDSGGLATPGDVFSGRVGPDGVPDSSQAEVIERDRNPGYPFWIAGIEGTVGQRPPTPPLDMITQGEAQALVNTGNPLWTSHPGFVNAADGHNGGLPRFTANGYLSGSDSAQVQTRMDFSKEITALKPTYWPEHGTDVEQVAMAFHGQRCHDSFLPDGTPAVCAGGDVTGDGLDDFGGFILNGAPPVPGAPFNDPCVDDQGALLAAGADGVFFSGENLNAMSVRGNSIFNATTPRHYKAANVQFDAVLNKLGYHFPQQRIITLWEDVVPTINKIRPPEPFVLRLNTFDCGQYSHTNLVPKVYELDDYQVRTPTDIIGQHIHLPKWDLTTADGAANGWNYEDGTLSPEMVIELIHAINEYNTAVAGADLGDDLEPIPTIAQPDGTGAGFTHLDDSVPHPFFGETAYADRWVGARTTLQRWFADPVVNVEGIDRGLGIIFTHDHYGPSTHQQVGLYATVLTEPAGSVWAHNETGVQLGDSAPGVNPAGREDGGPTSWQAAILTDTDPLSNVGAETVEDFREFYFEYSDFQHAYEKDVYVGVGADGLPITPHDITAPWGDLVVPENLPAVVGAPSIRESFRFAIEPSVREGIGYPHLLNSAPECPGPLGAEPARPCPEAITADDPGMFVVSYRNESLLARIYDPEKLASECPGELPGCQADGDVGDLGFALQSRADRVMDTQSPPRPLAQRPLNTPLGDAPATYTGAGDGPNATVPGVIGTVFVPPINQLSALNPGDPFTPMMRAYAGDVIAVKMQAGGDEESHATMVHGLKWLQAGSGHGKAGNSGWRNNQTSGISEQFTARAPVVAQSAQIGLGADYLYSHNPSRNGWDWGTWGLLRVYNGLRPPGPSGQPDLFPLPDNPFGTQIILNQTAFDGVCPRENPFDPASPPANLREYDVTAALANDILANVPGVTLVATGFEPGTDPLAGGGDLHYGGPLPDPISGGTLVYNSRPDQVGGILDPETGIVSPVKQGPIHDPTAILYVYTDDLEPKNAADAACAEANGGVRNFGCAVRLKAEAPVEPMVIRANAGDCMRITLRNRLPLVMPDLPNRNPSSQVVIRERHLGVADEGVIWFQNNDMRPSSEAGLHPALVTYDVTRADGTNVGINPKQTVSPFGIGTFTWYAGDLAQTLVGSFGGLNFVNLVDTPIEFGGFNLAPADKLKQGQKGMVGAGVIYPAGSAWTVDAGRHTAASVGPDGNADGVPDVTAFRDFTTVWQRGVNHYWAGGGDAIFNTEAEEGGITEDPGDAGHAAINYGTEPAWFRFGLDPCNEGACEHVGLGPFSDNDTRQLYSNDLVGADPETAVFEVTAGTPFRMHLLKPFAPYRKSSPHLHGHVWQRDPYVCPGDDGGIGLDGKCSLGVVGSRALGDNPIGFAIGGFQSLFAGGHFDIVIPSAGGANAVPADYLFREGHGLGNMDGLWGIVRVKGVE